MTQIIYLVVRHEMSLKTCQVWIQPVLREF